MGVTHVDDRVSRTRLQSPARRPSLAEPKRVPNRSVQGRLVVGNDNCARKLVAQGDSNPRLGLERVVTSPLNLDAYNTLTVTLDGSFRLKRRRQWRPAPCTLNGQSLRRSRARAGRSPSPSRIHSLARQVQNALRRTHRPYWIPSAGACRKLIPGVDQSGLVCSESPGPSCRLSWLMGGPAHHHLGERQAIAG